MAEWLTLMQGDCRVRLRDLPTGSVHCVVTSPPYYGLRDYGTAEWEGGDPACVHVGSVARTVSGSPGLQYRTHEEALAGINRVYSGDCRCGARRIDSQIGLEPTPDAYVAELVAVCREIRRVLRDDGTLWLNLGDSYNTQQAGNKTPSGFSQTRPSRVSRNGDQETVKHGRGLIRGLKPKDLLGIPWRVAFALQADGWWLRQDIIWHKPNPMPESATDRCTKAHEYLFLLAKQERYFYDAEAVKEASITGDTRKPYGSDGAWALDGRNKWAEGKGQQRDNADGTTRNRRSVWTVTTEPYAEAHFATYPPALIEPCILAGTSERGCCPTCGAPWERVVESERVMRHELPQDDPNYRPGRYTVKAGGEDDYAKGGGQAFRFSRTAGWRPVCKCPPADPVPCTVLDPFNGAGTTGLVAIRNGRRYIGCELNPDYIELTRKRILDHEREYVGLTNGRVVESTDPLQMPLFAEGGSDGSQPAQGA